MLRVQFQIFVVRMLGCCASWAPWIGKYIRLKVNTHNIEQTSSWKQRSFISTNQIIHVSGICIHIYIYACVLHACMCYDSICLEIPEVFVEDPGAHVPCVTYNQVTLLTTF